MARKTSMKDLVVIVPGILGSVLQKDGKDIWAVSGQAIWQVLTKTSRTIHNLKLSQDDPEAENLGDGIRATALIQDTHLITSVSHEQPAVNLDFVQRERDWLLTIDALKQGLYRVRVQTENSSEQAPTPVQDLFEVVR